MTANENYSKIVIAIFGNGSATFDTSLSTENKVTGALNFDGDYDEFKKNFKARLERLQKVYFPFPNYLKDVLDQVNLIADSKNWEGAFAELAAYDLFNQDILRNRSYLIEPVRPNVSLPNTDSLAGDLGKKETNVDGVVEDYGIFFDVKCFKDNVTEILEGIYLDLKRHLQNDDFVISAEHAMDISYDEFQTNRNRLLQELKNEINLMTKPTYVSSKVISNLSFRILWGRGMQTTEKIYHPYSHALNYHKTIFNYAPKFMKNHVSLIVLVKFPWYNQVIRDFADSNKDLYRGLSRRVFCQYRFDPTKFNSYYPKYTNNLTIYEVSRYLSGIIFLEDETILSNDPNKVNVKSFTYLNPNAINDLTKKIGNGFINSISNVVFDDFNYDNY